MSDISVNKSTGSSLDSNQTKSNSNQATSEDWISSPHYYDTPNNVRNQALRHTIPVRDRLWLKSNYNRLGISRHHLRQINNLARFAIGRDGQPLTQTLQGHVYSGIDLVTGRKVIIKQSSINLVDNHLSLNNRIIDEDIHEEARILRNVSRSNGNASISQFINFFNDNKYYYLISEHGGQDMFEYIINMIDYVQSGRISKKEWKFRVKYYFKQIVRAIYYLHVICGIAHLDLSLENSVIDLFGPCLSTDNNNTTNKNGRIREETVRIIDFGLARESWNKDWKCKEVVGKKQYQSPEIRELREVYRKHNEDKAAKEKVKKVKKSMGFNMSEIDDSIEEIEDIEFVKNLKGYDARKADIWSLGVMLFVMSVGLSPWKAAEYEYQSFKEIMNGNMEKLLKLWKRHDWVEPDAIDLMEKIFKCEDERLNIQQVMKHPYVRDAPVSLGDNLDILLKIQEKHEKELEIERKVEQMKQKLDKRAENCEIEEKKVDFYDDWRINTKRRSSQI